MEKTPDHLAEIYAEENVALTKIASLYRDPIGAMALLRRMLEDERPNEMIDDPGIIQDYSDLLVKLLETEEALYKTRVRCATPLTLNLLEINLEDLIESHAAYKRAKVKRQHMEDLDDSDEIDSIVSGIRLAGEDLDDSGREEDIADSGVSITEYPLEPETTKIRTKKADDTVSSTRSLGK